jgi:hypothetical protein
LRALSAAEKKTLGDNYVGMYMQGSLAIGDFDMTSDVDFIIVVCRELSGDEVRKVQEIHERFYARQNRWVKRLEYSFFPVAKLHEPSSPYSEDGTHKSSGRELWYFDNGHKQIEKSDHCNTLVTRWTLREHGIVVDGIDPKTLIPPIPADELRCEMRNTALGWGAEVLADPASCENRFYQSYLVLNFSRILHDITVGEVNSKKAGVEWAKENLDPEWHELIDFCWQERQDTEISIKQPADRIIFHQSIQFVDYILGLIRHFQQ